MKWLLRIAPVVLFFACCRTQPKRMDVRMRNTGTERIEIRASAGIFSRTIVLEPGQAWAGWIPADLVPAGVTIEVRNKKDGP